MNSISFGSPFEMAVIIQRSYQSIHEKHLAFHILMKKHPDMSVISTNHAHEKHESFHEEFRNLIKYKEETIVLFMKSEPNAVYSYQLPPEEGRNGEELPYSSYEKILDVIKKDIDEDNRPPIIVVNKIFLNDEWLIEARIDRNENIYSINKRYVKPPLDALSVYPIIFDTHCSKEGKTDG